MTKEQKDWTIEELKKDYLSVYTAVTIPVNIHLEGRQTILDLSEAEKLLREARLITLENCGCRVRWKKCDAPLDVCLSLDNEAENALKRGAKRVSVEEALQALKRSHEAGLVHLAFSIKGREKAEIICSCCSCCCHSLSALVRFGIPEAVVSSKFVATTDAETCINCGTCVKRCQFHARQLVNDKLVFDQKKCFGCGLCVSTCPTNSITLTEKH
ncbi:MAG: 4Fe-4S binding protein [Candidatus Bathyarchaeia archaeon]